MKNDLNLKNQDWVDMNLYSHAKIWSRIKNTKDLSQKQIVYGTISRQVENRRNEEKILLNFPVKTPKAQCRRIGNHLVLQDGQLGSIKKIMMMIRPTGDRQFNQVEQTIIALSINQKIFCNNLIKIHRRLHNADLNSQLFHLSVKSR